MIISDFDKDIPHRNCALRAAAPCRRAVPSPDNFTLCTEIFTLSSGCSPSFGQQLISQEILLLPLIYRGKLSDIEACLGKSPYNWFPEKGCQRHRLPSLLVSSLSPPFASLCAPFRPCVIHVGPCSRARLENSR